MIPQRQIPPRRKALYYIGMAVAVIGLVMFISVFVSFALHFGDFSNFEEYSRSMLARGVIGFILFGGGGLLMIMGRLGLAGSGVKLDPAEARRDVEPWARMGGGVIKDVLEEANIKLGSQHAGETLPFDERLRRLQKLREDGLVSEQEFEAARKKILEEA